MSVIIIIGLPGSGKTILSNKYIDDKYIVYDDFIRKFFNGKVIDSIKSGHNICLIDPRLCIPKIFEKYITVIEEYTRRDNILLVLFENNPAQCIRNVKNRLDGKKNIETTINRYSLYYDTDNYAKYHHKIIPVYQ